MDYLEVTDYNGDEVGLILLYTCLLENFVEYVFQSIFSMYVNYFYFVYAAKKKQEEKKIKAFFIKSFTFTSSFTN